MASQNNGPGTRANTQYEWKFDATVRQHFRMIGDRLSSPVIELGGGLAVYVRAKIIGSLFGKYDNMLVLKLKPLATDGASKRKNNLPKGRWMVTFKYSAPDFVMRGRKFSGRYHIIASNASLHTDYTLHFEFSTKSAARPAGRQHAPSIEILAQKMGGLLTSGVLTDVVLVASDGRELSAHRAILAAHSQVFRAMFTNQMNERAEGRVVIPDADSHVLGKMLEWMYTGKINDLADLAVARGLLLVADKYHLDEFKEHCEHAFPAPEVKTVCDMLALAQLYGAQVLKARATAFIKANAAAVTKTEGWRDLLRVNPELLGDLFTAVLANATV